MLIDLEADDPRWEAALPVLRELRPHLTRELLDQIMAEGANQGLRFTAIFAEERCLAVAGWRIVATTGVVRKLHVEDLSTTDAERSHGHGRALLEALIERARANGCRTLELDSAVHRHAAHRFYLRERMDISSHHFSRRISQ